MRRSKFKLTGFPQASRARDARVLLSHPAQSDPFLQELGEIAEPPVLLPQRRSRFAIRRQPYSRLEVRSPFVDLIKHLACNFGIDLSEVSLVIARMTRVRIGLETLVIAHA